MNHLTSIQTIPSEPLEKLDILGRGPGGAKHTTRLLDYWLRTLALVDDT